MGGRADYPYDDALEDLEIFFKSHVKDPATLHEIQKHLQECRNAKRLGFRYIHERLMKYRKDFSDYFPMCDEEKKMIDDLFYFWG